MVYIYKHVSILSGFTKSLIVKHAHKTSVDIFVDTVTSLGHNSLKGKITLLSILYTNFLCTTGQVTYRVVQVTDGTESAQVVATNAFQPGAQVR